MRALFLSLIVFSVGCGPLHYVRSNPIEPPQPIEAPSLTTPVWVSGLDCGRFTFDDQTSSWKEASWVQLGGEIDTVEPGDVHPAVGGVDHLARCRHVVISPGAWVVSREARDRYPLVRNQLELWRDYSERSASRSQKESEAIAELLKMARKRQVESFVVGSAVGAGAVTVVILSIVLAGR